MPWSPGFGRLLFAIPWQGATLGGMFWLVACTTTAIDLGGPPPGDSAAPGPVALERVPGDTAWAEDTAEPEALPGLYDDPVRIWQFALELDGDAWDQLRRDGRDYVPATLQWEGRQWPVQVHIKGSSSWQDIDQKPSLVVDVNRDDPDQELFGVKKFYLQNECYDPSHMSSALSYAFYREWGYPASRTAFAQLQVNGRDYGFYDVMEPHNDDFLQAWFAEPDGNLYENRDAYCDVTDLDCMEVEEDDEGSHEAFERLGDAARARGASWRPAVEPLLSWDRFIDALALEITIAHWDSYSYDLSNYQVYHEPVADDWTLLTQSMDLDYGFRPWSYPDCGQYGMDIDKYTMGMLASSCHLDSTCKAELVQRVSEYADALEAADGAARVRELDAVIGDAVKADPRRYYADSEYVEHVACLQTFFDARPGQLRAWVAENR